MKLFDFLLASALVGMATSQLNSDPVAGDDLCMLYFGMNSCTAVGDRGSSTTRCVPGPCYTIWEHHEPLPEPECAAVCPPAPCSEPEAPPEPEPEPEPEPPPQDPCFVAFGMHSCPVANSSDDNKTHCVPDPCYTNPVPPQDLCAKYFGMHSCPGADGGQTVCAPEPCQLAPEPSLEPEPLSGPECASVCGWSCDSPIGDDEFCEELGMFTCPDGDGGVACLFSPCEPEPEPEPEFEPEPTPAPPPPITVAVEVVTYTTEQRAAAVDDLSSALQDAQTVNTALVSVASTATFNIDVSAIAEGTEERTTFEVGFKNSLAASLGGAVAASAVVIDGISAARRRLQHSFHRQLSGHEVVVDFHIDAPASVQVQAASLVKTLKESGATIDITVGGVTYSADTAAMAEPVVTRSPDVDCEGSFSVCSASCSQTYSVTVVGSGLGLLCELDGPTVHGAISTCTAGTGNCAPVPEPELETVVLTPISAVPIAAAARVSTVASLTAAAGLLLWTAI